MTSFNQIGEVVKLARMNYGAPDSMKERTPVKTTDMINKTIVIDEIVVMNKLKRDENGQPVKSKKDPTKDIYQPVVYIAFDGDKYFATKSGFLIDQLKEITSEQLVYFYEKQNITIPDVNGVKVKITQEKVKYRDGKLYDQIKFVDAE